MAPQPGGSSDRANQRASIAVVSLIDGRAAIAVVGAISEDCEIAKDLLAVDADPVRLACRLPEPRPIPVVDDGIGREPEAKPGELCAP